MACEQCHALLEAYKRSVKLYGDAALKMSGTVGDDFRLGLEKARGTME